MLLDVQDKLSWTSVGLRDSAPLCAFSRSSSTPVQNRLRNIGNEPIRQPHCCRIASGFICKKYNKDFTHYEVFIAYLFLFRFAELYK